MLAPHFLFACCDVRAVVPLVGRPNARQRSRLSSKHTPSRSISLPDCASNRTNNPTLSISSSFRHPRMAITLQRHFFLDNDALIARSTFQRYDRSVELVNGVERPHAPKDEQLTAQHPP